VRLVQVAGGEPVRAEETVAVERTPLPIGAPGEVGDDHVRVQVWILRAACPVSEGGGDEAARPLPHPPALATPRDAGFPLEIGKCRPPGRLVRLRHRPTHLLVVSEGVEEAHTLRAGEDEVEAGHRREPLLLLDEPARLGVDSLDRDRPVPDRRPQPLAARWVEAAQKRPHLSLLDDARESELLGAAPCPHARRLATTGVVVVQAAGDLLLVVGLLPDRQLGHAQHAAPLAHPNSAETHMH
jgi:hypothetical protein